MMYGDGGGFDLESANNAVNAIADAFTSIADIKAQQEQYDAMVEKYKYELQLAKTQADITKINSYITYYQYISDSLQDMIEMKEKTDRNNNIKRVAIFGGAIAVALLLVGLAYKNKR